MEVAFKLRVYWLRVAASHSVRAGRASNLISHRCCEITLTRIDSATTVQHPCAQLMLCLRSDNGTNPHVLGIRKCWHTGV